MNLPEPRLVGADAGDEPQIAQSAEAAAHGALADVEVLGDARCGKASVDIEHGEHFLVIQREARVLLGRPGSRRLLHLGQVGSGHGRGVDGVRVRYRGGQKAV